MKKILLYLIKYLPRKKISGFIGWMSNIENERFQRTLIKLFIKKYNVNIEEMLYPVEKYKNLQQFFIRELKPNVRQIDSNTVVAPVDGVMTECGNLIDNKFLCKGELLSARDLIADDNFFEDIKDGFFTVHYLNPRDYHWIHSPVDGEIYKIERLKGDLYPVFDDMVKTKKNILCINERCNVFIRNDKIKICVSMIAAMGVGNIVISDNILQMIKSDDFSILKNNPIKISKGERLGYFALGSTVVLVFNNFEPNYNLRGLHIKFGTGISRI